MDVQCERCKTEYEFDDALVSARGTTVRCTHCGHEFKVRRMDSANVAGDRWIVETSSGQHLTFLTLRELQRAILAKQVARRDILLLSGAPPRPLGSISELEPFFEGRSSSRPPGAATEGTGQAAAPEPAVPPLRVPSFVPLGESVAPPISHPTPFAAPSPSFAPPPVQASHATPPSPPPPPAVRMPEIFSPMPPPTIPVRRSMPSTDDEFDEAHGAFRHAADDASDYPRRRKLGGWVVTFVLLLAVGVVGWVAAKPYLLAPSGASGVPLDARAQAFLAAGEKGLADGDLEGAQQDFDKASVLAEHDKRVLIDEAKVAVARADVPWLKVRLLAGETADEARATKAQLDERVARARKAADDAVAVAPDDHAAVRVKIDALRLQGNRDDARSYVAQVGGLATEPEAAYVLAALDLTEPEPFWTTVIDRLRAAASAEGTAGRARAALVYALGKSGDWAAAREELSRLDAFARPYPCLPDLHAWIAKAPTRPTDRGNAGSVPHIDVSSLPQVPAVPNGAVAAAGDGIPGDQVGSMHAALQAIKKGDWDRARRIYETLAARNPNDSEALAGIADVARSQGDTTGAIDAYKRALAVNPSYLPALLGVADTEWASGDHASARRVYKDITDRFPDGAYPAYVKTRAEGSSGVSGTTGASGASGVRPAAPAASSPPAASGSKGWDPGDGI